MLLTLSSLYLSLTERLDRASWLVPTLARLTFAAVLLLYFWKSATTKLGEGIFGFLMPSDGAYVQMFPKAMEAAGYDSGQLGFFHWLVAAAGTTAEFVLPALILVGLFTRLAALGMIGFVFVQSLTDIYGHGVAGRAIGALFDRFADAAIWDQRTLWVFVLLVLVIRGAGPISIDHGLRAAIGPRGAG